jgi:hypothetical protein
VVVVTAAVVVLSVAVACNYSFFFFLSFFFLFLSVFFASTSLFSSVSFSSVVATDTGSSVAVLGPLANSYSSSSNSFYFNSFFDNFGYCFCGDLPIMILY